MANWIPLLVPEEAYLDLALLVAARAIDRRTVDPPTLVVRAPSAAESAARDGTDAATQAVAAFRAWNRDDLRRLARGDTLTTQRWTRAIDFCAQQVGTFFSTGEIAGGTGMASTEWRDAQRKLGKHLRAHFPMTRGAWPLAAFTTDHVQVAITAEQAATWSAVRAEVLPYGRQVR